MSHARVECQRMSGSEMLGLSYRVSLVVATVKSGKNVKTRRPVGQEDSPGRVVPEAEED